MANRVRSFTRVDDELWDLAGKKSADEGTTISAVVRDALADYVEDRPVAEDLKRAIKRLNAIQRRLNSQMKIRPR